MSLTTGPSVSQTPTPETTPTPTPEPEPEPEPVVFTVIVGTGSVSPTTLMLGGSALFSFPVTANSAGTVNYSLVVSLNGSEHTLISSSLTFTTPGTQNAVLNLLSLGGSPWNTATNSSSNWAQLRVTSPNVVSSNQAPFTFVSLFEA